MEKYWLSWHELYAHICKGWVYLLLASTYAAQSPTAHCKRVRAHRRVAYFCLCGLRIVHGRIGIVPSRPCRTIRVRNWIGCFWNGTSENFANRLSGRWFNGKFYQGWNHRMPWELQSRPVDLHEVPVSRRVLSGRHWWIDWCLYYRWADCALPVRNNLLWWSLCGWECVLPFKLWIHTPSRISTEGWLWQQHPQAAWGPNFGVVRDDLADFAGGVSGYRVLGTVLYPLPWWTFHHLLRLARNCVFHLDFENAQIFWVLESARRQSAKKSWHWSFQAAWRSRAAVAT